MNELIEQYLQGIRNDKIRDLTDGWVEICTDELDIHNDYISIYLQKQDDGSYIINDDGDIAWGLKGIACIQQIDNAITEFSGYDRWTRYVKMSGDELTTTSHETILAIRCQVLLETICKIYKHFESKNEG